MTNRDKIIPPKTKQFHKQTNYLTITPVIQYKIVNFPYETNPHFFTLILLF